MVGGEVCRGGLEEVVELFGPEATPQAANPKTIRITPSILIMYLKFLFTEIAFETSLCRYATVTLVI